MPEAVIETTTDWSQADSIRIVKANPQHATPAIGVNFHGLWDMYWTSGAPVPAFGQHLDSLKNHGVDLVRVDFGWSTAMPTNAWAPDTNYYLKRLKLLLDATEQRGLKVLLTLHQSPTWARPSTGTEKQFPSDLGAWQTFCHNIAATFGPRVHAWQVWNEPNLKSFTGVDSTDPAVHAERYLPVLQRAHTGLKAGHPGATVVFGGPSQTDAAFIDACYSRGSKDYFDIMAWHPYQGNQTKSPLATDLYEKPRATYGVRVLEHMAYWRDNTKPVWWTECGVSVHSNDGITDVSRYGVATAEISAAHYLEYLELARRYPQVERVNFYVAYKTGDVHQAGYSIMTADGTPLPQLQAIGQYLNA